MSNSPEVRIDVEYCGTCGHIKQFMEMSEQVKKTVPNVEITGVPGRQASFELKVNDELVYSKLQTLAFPDFNEVTEMVQGVTEGKSVAKIKKQQPITCVIS